MRVWSGLQRIGIIGKNILLYTPGSFAYDPSPLLLLYDSAAAVAFSPRARAPGATTLLLRIFVGKLPRRPVASKERKRKKGRNGGKLCAGDGPGGFVLFFFKGGHVDTCVQRCQTRTWGVSPPSARL